MNPYLSFGIRQGIDVVAVVMLAYGIYLRTSRRWDVAASLVALNIGLVAVLTALIAMPHGGTSGLTVGFGLFAVLSIVRLRSEASSLTEVAYFFTALALGVVNGVGLQALGLMIVLDVVLVGSMALLELTRRPDEGERQVLVADEVFDSRALLVEHLSRRLGAHVSDVKVVEVDLVRETTRVEALVTEARARGLPTAPERNVVPWQLGRRRSTRRDEVAAPLPLSRDGSRQ
jgi:hypothetical protein